MSSVAAQSETRIVIPNVRWEVFEALGDSDCAGTRFAYDKGMLEIMSPSIEHESFHRALGRMVETLTEELNIPIFSAGSTTLKLQMEQRGIEPDECYYVAHEARMRGRHDFDLAIDPPPDLAIEVDILRSSLDKLDIYAEVGVPEVWLYDGELLRVHRLHDTRRYGHQSTSVAFAFLDISEIERFLERFGELDETSWIRAFRAWVREQYGHLTRQ
jgi:Uma2 family endonuclease